MEMTELMDKYLELQEQLKAKDEEVASLKSQHDSFLEKENSLSAEIGKLKEANMSLFLRVSQPVEPEVETEKVENPQPATWDDFMSQW